MALYKYKKAPLKIKEKPTKTKKKKRTVTIATVLDRITLKISQKLTHIKPISFIIPFVFILSGFIILYGQMKPYLIHFIQAKFSDKLNQEIISLVPQSYEEIRSSYISDPGSDYFSNILNDNEDSSETQEYTGQFYLTIEEIQINEAPVTANVDSSKESVYQDALGKGLAHFKGSNLPGGNGNVLIYGHSAAGDYAEKNPDDVVTAFTRLFKLNIGDNIKINFEDKNYKYTIKKIKEINPDDVEVLQNNGGKTLTLMTCSPPGLNSRRLVITAIQQ